MKRLASSFTVTAFAFILTFVVPPTPYAFGQLFDGGIDIPSPESIANSLEQRYHLNLGEIQNQGEMFNVSDQKKISPEVILSFSPSDPKPGEEMTARAFPVYFNIERSQLYYTWYLKRDGCAIGSSDLTCDSDGNGRVDEEDWKVDATRIIANNTINRSEIDYSDGDTSDNDNDGYNATPGGNERRGNSYCYIQARSSGELYELEGCRHLFPNASSGSIPNETGNGRFTLEEERFWGTNPNDPDTANTGVGDEANIVGLGRDTFKWNYQVGDQVGVAVEGVSMIPTKHKDNSMMIMWALPNNDCDVRNTGSYQKNIRGYDVTIRTSETDINDCLEDNLVDPREGGQQETVDVTLTSLVQEPINDSSGNNYGDSLSLIATATNSTSSEDSLFYNWTVEMSSNGNFDPRGYTRSNANDESEFTSGSWVDITGELLANDLIGRVEGNNLSEISTKLDLTNDFLQNVGLSEEDAFSNDIGYLRVRVNVKEQFAEGVFREGFATIIVQVINSDTVIIPALPTVSDNKFSIGDTEICNDASDLRRGTCYVAKNEVIALSITDSDLDSFSWKLDGSPLICDADTSPQCENARQNRYNFFPITADPGQRHVITATAIDEETGDTNTFTRVFEVVEPSMAIISTDTDTAWPKYLGYYEDTDNKIYSEISTDVLQGYAQSTAKLKAIVFPNFLDVTRQWIHTAELSQENSDGTLSIPILRNPGDSYSVSVEAFYRQDSDIREAMKQVWNLNPRSTSEFWLKKSIQLEVIENYEENDYSFDSPNLFFASLLKNSPTYLWFAIQSLLSIAVIVFFLALLYSMTPNRRR